jgi:hypothetical protein
MTFIFQLIVQSVHSTFEAPAHRVTSDVEPTEMTNFSTDDSFGASQPLFGNVTVTLNRFIILRRRLSANPKSGNTQTERRAIQGGKRKAEATECIGNLQMLIYDLPKKGMNGAASTGIAGADAYRYVLSPSGP